MSLTLIVVLSLVSYRITRFLILDTLIRYQRSWLLMKLLGDNPGTVRTKLHDLAICHYCLSIWIAAGATAITAQFTPVALPVWVWLAASAGAVAVWRYTEG